MAFSVSAPVWGSCVMVVAHNDGGAISAQYIEGVKVRMWTKETKRNTAEEWGVKRVSDGLVE